jgi:hypothetical protein
MRAGGFSLSRRPPPRAGPPPPRPLLQAGVYAWPPNLARPRDPPVQPARCVFVCAPLATTRPVRGGNTTPPNPTQQPYSRPPLPPLPRVPLPSASVAAPLRPLSLFEGRPLLLTLPPMPHSRPMPPPPPPPTHPLPHHPTGQRARAALQKSTPHAPSSPPPTPHRPSPPRHPSVRPATGCPPTLSFMPNPPSETQARPAVPRSLCAKLAAFGRVLQCAATRVRASFPKPC